MTSQKVQRAVAKVNARQKANAAVLQQVTIPVTREAIRVTGSGQLAFTRGKQTDDRAMLLLFDPKLGAFRPILTPPGTSWELVEKRQGPSLWQPGRPT